MAAKVPITLKLNKDFYFKTYKLAIMAYRAFLESVKRSEGGWGKRHSAAEQQIKIVTDELFVGDAYEVTNVKVKNQIAADIMIAALSMRYYDTLAKELPNLSGELKKETILEMGVIRVMGKFLGVEIDPAHERMKREIMEADHASVDGKSSQIIRPREPKAPRERRRPKPKK